MKTIAFAFELPEVFVLFLTGNHRKSQIWNKIEGSSIRRKIVGNVLERVKGSSRQLRSVWTCTPTSVAPNSGVGVGWGGGWFRATPFGLTVLDYGGALQQWFFPIILTAVSFLSEKCFVWISSWVGRRQKKTKANLVSSHLEKGRTVRRLAAALPSPGPRPRPRIQKPRSASKGSGPLPVGVKRTERTPSQGPHQKCCHTRPSETFRNEGGAQKQTLYVPSWNCSLGRPTLIAHSPVFPLKELLKIAPEGRSREAKSVGGKPQPPRCLWG